MLDRVNLRKALSRQRLKNLPPTQLKPTRIQDLKRI